MPAQYQVAKQKTEKLLVIIEALDLTWIHTDLGLHEEQEQNCSNLKL